MASAGDFVLTKKGMDKMKEHPRNAEDGIKMSSAVKPMTGELIIAAAFPSIRNQLSVDTLHNLRLVSRHCKMAVDTQQIMIKSSDPFSAHPSVINLSSFDKVKEFTLDMTGPFSDPIPFEIRCSLDTAPDLFQPSYPEYNEVLLFWSAVALMAEAIGHRITSLVLDIRMNPTFNDESLVDKIIRQILWGSLGNTPNLECLLFQTSTIYLQRAIKKLYRDGNTKIGIPTLLKLKHLEVKTVGEGPEHETMVHDYPACFIRAVNTALTSLTLSVNGYQLAYLDKLPVGRNLKHLRYNISNCSCRRLIPEPNLLKGLDKHKYFPKVPNLETLVVQLDWCWRPKDLFYLLKWLSARFANRTVDQLIIQSSSSSIELQKLSQDIFAQKKSAKFSWKWRSTLGQMPIVRSLKALTPGYKESWIFLASFRETLEELTITYSDSVEILVAGFLQKKFAVCDCCGGDNRNATNKTRIFQYFPRLEKLHVVDFGFRGQQVKTVSRKDLEGLEGAIRRKEWIIMVSLTEQAIILAIGIMIFLYVLRFLGLVGPTSDFINSINYFFFS